MVLFKLRWPIIIIGAVLIVAICFLNWYVPRSDEAARAETISIGDEIVKALDSYFGEHGKYPGSLEALVPKYLDEIKAPPWGEAWKYEAYHKGFLLKTGYRGSGESYYPSMSYDSVGKTWIDDR